MSSLTVGFKICAYLDRYSNVLAQTSHMFCMGKPAAVVLLPTSAPRMCENDVTCW